MKKLFLVLFCLTMLGTQPNVSANNFNQIVLVDSLKKDTVKVKPKRCDCEKKEKRAKKRNGTARSKFGRTLFDVLDVLEEFVPFLKNIFK